MIFPVKDKYSVMYGSATFWLSAQGQAGQTFSQCVWHALLCKHNPSHWSPSCSLHPVQTEICLILYRGSRQAASCPGTETPCCEETGSQPGADCCSALDVGEVSAKKNTQCYKHSLEQRRDFTVTSDAKLSQSRYSILLYVAMWTHSVTYFWIIL